MSLWFDGGIVNALNKSTTQKLILLVYLEGDNKASKLMREQLETDESIRTLVSEKAIPLILVENSNDAKMFNQIYPSEQSPTVYLISNSGKLIASFSQTLDKDTFIKNLNSSNSSINQSKQSTTKSPELPSVSVSVPTSSSAAGDNRTIEEKRKDLIERIKEKNKKDEEQRSKNSEMERIKSGRELQKLRKEHEQREAEELIKQREKDAVLDKKERERVLKQIEEDRLEKEARFEKERLQREEEYNRKKQEEKNTLKSRAIIKLEENEIKIQFRLPSSNTLITKFDKDDTLQKAVDYVKENSDLRLFQFALMYPKRNYSSKDFVSKFSDLGIKCSAVLLVVEEECVRSSSSNRGTVVGGSIFDSIWSIIISVSTIVISLITGLFRSLFGTAGDTATGQQPTPGPSSGNQFDARKRGIKSNFDRDDKDNNTYNGNSTEQQPK